jgi:hypothetical protein
MPKEVLTVRVERETIDALTAGAESRGMSRSEWLRNLIELRNTADANRRPAA